MFKMVFHINSFIVSLIITFTGTACFLINYLIPKFDARFFFLVYFDGLSGLFNPLFSSLKSQMIPEHLRTTIMNFFRIPINSFSVLSLILTQYIDTYEVSLVKISSIYLIGIINYSLYLNYFITLIRRYAW